MTWEPLSYLDNIRELIDDYESKHFKKRKDNIIKIKNNDNNNYNNNKKKKKFKKKNINKNQEISKTEENYDCNDSNASQRYIDMMNITVISETENQILNMDNKSKTKTSNKYKGIIDNQNNKFNSINMSSSPSSSIVSSSDHNTDSLTGILRNGYDYNGRDEIKKILKERRINEDEVEYLVEFEPRAVNSCWLSLAEVAKLSEDALIKFYKEDYKAKI